MYMRLWERSKPFMHLRSQMMPALMISVSSPIFKDYVIVLLHMTEENTKKR